MGYATAMLKNPTLAEEIVHEAFLSAFAAWEKFEGKSQRSTWLWSILRNECFQHFRNSKLKYTLSPLEELETIPSGEASAENQLIENTNSQRVEEAMQSLSLVQREILELRLAELSLEEISLMLKLPVSTVKSHVFRDKKALCDFLKEAQVEESA